MSLQRIRQLIVFTATRTVAVLLIELSVCVGGAKAAAAKSVVDITSTDAVGNKTTYNLYDEHGRLLQSTDANGLVTTLKYDSRNRLIEQKAGGEITTYLYSGRNRLTQIKQGASVIARYAYNGFGERVAKTVGGFTTYFLHDEDGHLSGEYDQTGKLIQETVWLDDTPVAMLRPTTPGQPISAANPLKVYLVWADHLDTPRVITTNDAANQTVWSWDSDPFGTTLASGSISYNLRFPGQYYDAETGLHYNYFRDYNPETGRYVQSDPIGLEGGINPYLYVEATPFTDVDETGERRRRGGRQKAIDRIRNDPNTPRCVKGWFQQEENHKKRGGRGKYKTKYTRLPPGYDLAHPYGKESCKGCDYNSCCLNDRATHRNQTKAQRKKGIF